MKTIIFVCVVIFFTSCAKDSVKNNDLDFGLGATGWCRNTVSGNQGNQVKANMSAGEISSQLSAVTFSANFNRYVPDLSNDGSLISITGQAADTSIRINLVNIVSAGTYQFGSNTGYSCRAEAGCTIGSNNYFNDPHMSSGSIMIDTLTTKYIHGSFNVTCRKGMESLHITNGTFSGNF